MEVIIGFSETLKDLIKERDVTLKELSEALNTSYYVILKWKSGKKNPKTSSLIKLANYFNCSIEYLCGKTREHLNYVPQEPPAFGGWLDQVLKERNKTSYQLFKRTSIKNSQYHYWKKGSEPLLTSLEMVAQFLDVTLDHLIGRDR